MKRKTIVSIFTLILVLLALSGCKTRAHFDGQVPYDNMKLPNALGTGDGLTWSDKGWYFNNGLALYFLPKGSSRFIFLEHLIYKDDQAIPQEETGYYKSYQDSPACHDSLINLDDKLFYMSSYEDVEGNKKYFLNCLNAGGRERAQLLELSFDPYAFLVNQGHILVTEFAQDGACQIHLYNPQLKEKLVTLPKNVNKLYAAEQGFYLVTDEQRDDVYMESLYQLDFEGDFTLLDEVGGFVSFVSGDYYVLNERIGGEEEKTRSILKKMNGQVVLEDPDRDICFVDDQYYYTEAKGPVQVYARYHLKGDLDAVLVPSEALGSLGQPIISEDKDFDGIERILGDEFLVRQLDRDRGQLIYILGSFASGDFKILDSSAMEI